MRMWPPRKKRDVAEHFVVEINVPQKIPRSMPLADAARDAGSVGERRDKRAKSKEPREMVTATRSTRLCARRRVTARHWSPKLYRFSFVACQSCSHHHRGGIIFFSYLE